MKTHEDIMELLGGLSVSDRSWIIERLSPESRSILLDGKRSAQTSARSLPARQSHDETGTELASLDPEQIAAVLTIEPAWVAQALLERPWPWRNRVLELLPPPLRSEVERLQASDVRYSPKILDLLNRKIAAAASIVKVEKKVSRTDEWLARIGANWARKRMRIAT